MNSRLVRAIGLLVCITFLLIYFTDISHSQVGKEKEKKARNFDEEIIDNAESLLVQGRQVFRFETFGDEVFWTDQLKLHLAIQGAQFGGVGDGLSPREALAAGLKVDLDAIPQPLVNKLKRGGINLDDPAVTLELLKLNAVVGVIGTFNDNSITLVSNPPQRAQALKSIGLTCAVCHSTVDDAFAPGIGHRLDGWANRDLNVGGVVLLAPDLSAITELLGVDEATVRAVLASWGPGKFDAELNLDGKAFRPDGKPAATLIPPAFGLPGVNNHTWGGGWGTVTYWNAFVANLELQGQGVFFDRRLDNAAQYPIAAKAGFGNKRSDPDQVTEHLASLHFYQLAIPSPTPPDGSYDKAAALRGQAIFTTKANCDVCHVPPLFTEPGWNTHKAADICIDDFQANRSPDSSYRTAPLKGLWTHTKGGFYHDGRFANLLDVVNHYNTCKNLNLSEQEKTDLVEYLKSL
jgi:hypothetical protein